MSRQYRHEIKYIISKSQAEILKRRLSMIMYPDPNGLEGYFIRSLYFDSPNSDAYYEKMDGIEFRRKYRIRIYNKDNKYIRLEKKIKDNDMTAKEQVLITKKQCLDLVSGNISLDGIDNKLLKEFIIEIKTKNLKPSVIVDYDRYALLYPVSDVRITFDSNIKSGKYNSNLFDFNYCRTNVIENNLLVLEVKYNEVLPESLAIILTTIPSIRNSFSKFAMCRGIK